MPLINIHTHQAPEEHGDLFIQNIFPSDDMLSLQPGGFYSVGLHPWFIANDQNYKNELHELEKRASLPEVIAIGECGLDKLANTESQLQLEVFVLQSQIAESVNKPLLIHCVKSYNEISHLKRRMKPKVPWILHGYTGNDMITKELIPMDFYFSLGKILMSDNSNIMETLKKLPGDRLFFETDEWKKPVKDIYTKYAELKDVTVESLADQVMWNFRQVFIRQ
jgi:TatD DNase family protein